MEKYLLNLDKKLSQNSSVKFDSKFQLILWNLKPNNSSIELNLKWNQVYQLKFFFQFLHNWNNSDRQPVDPTWRTQRALFGAFRSLAVSRIWSRKKGEDHLEDTRSSGVFSSLIPSSFIKELYPLATGLLFFCCWLLVHNVFHKLKERYFGKHVLIVVE